MKRLGDCSQAHAGLLLALTSACLMSAYSIVYQSIQDEIQRSTILVLRGLVQFGLLFGIAWGVQTRIGPQIPSSSTPCKMWTALGVVVVTGGFRLLFIFVGLQCIPSGTVLTILNGSPVLIMAISHFIVDGDQITLKKLVCALVLATGIALNYQMNQWSEQISGKTIVGLLASSLALIFSSLGSVFSKIAGRAFDKRVISSYIGLSVILVSGVSALLEPWIFAWTKPPNESPMPPWIPYFPTSPQVWLMGLAVAVLGSIQQYCNIAALQLDQPSRVSMVRASNIPLSFVLDWILMNAPMDWDRILGAFLVCLAIVASNLPWQIVFCRRPLRPASESSECDLNSNRSRSSGSSTIEINHL